MFTHLERIMNKSTQIHTCHTYTYGKYSSLYYLSEKSQHLQFTARPKAHVWRLVRDIMVCLLNKRPTDGGVLAWINLHSGQPNSIANMLQNYSICFPWSPITIFYGLVSEPPFFSVKVYHHPKGTTILLMVVDFQGFRNTSHSHIWTSGQQQCRFPQVAFSFSTSNISTSYKCVFTTTGLFRTLKARTADANIISISARNAMDWTYKYIRIQVL